MTVPTPDLRRLSDAEIWDRMHDGMVGSDLHKQCVLTLQMRNTERQTQASNEMAKATKELARFTNGLMWATWGLFTISGALALIALVQLYLSWKGGKP